jgi:uncharacterized protein with ParB-like and HNH nuclease domain
MSTANKFEDMSAIKALEYAKNRNLLLPDIQREYVWEIDEIERLFESIVDDYPIGSCIFWKTNKTTINKDKPNLYYFIRDFDKKNTKNEKAPETLNDDSEYYIVLDGQQRITSLNIALFGSYKYYKGGRGRAWNNPKSWIKKELYYNLDFYNTDTEEDEEHPRKRFNFLTIDEAKTGNFYKINNILAFDKLQDYMKDMIHKNFNEKCIDDLSTLYQRLYDASGRGLIHYYSISENSYDEALDIFVRVNSTGRKLSKSDLLFSTLIDGWKEGKENVETLIASMNSKGSGFNFSRDYLMRLCLVLVDADTNLKITSLSKNTIGSVRDNWDKISSALNDLSDILADIGLYDENLTSYNATMPVAYYLYKGGKIKTIDEKKEVKKFLSVSMAKRLFGVASNSSLNSTRNVLKALNCKKTSFNLDLFSSITLTGARTFIVDEEKDIDYWLDNYEKGQNTYLLLSLLYPNVKLNQVAFHQDHCHPYASFEFKVIGSLGLDKETIKEWQKKRNLLPNLQFLKDNENESKNKTPLEEWINQGNKIEYHPKDVSLKLQDFDLFFNERRKLIKDELMKIFNV